MPIDINQLKYMNNLVEQDHRGVKKPVKNRQYFRAFHSAHRKIKGIEAVRMIYKGQIEGCTSITKFVQDFIAA